MDILIAILVVFGVAFIVLIVWCLVSQICENTDNIDKLIENNNTLMSNQEMLQDRIIKLERENTKLKKKLNQTK